MLCFRRPNRGRWINQNNEWSVSWLGNQGHLSRAQLNRQTFSQLYDAFHDNKSYSSVHLGLWELLCQHNLKHGVRSQFGNRTDGYQWFNVVNTFWWCRISFSWHQKGFPKIGWTRSRYNVWVQIHCIERHRSQTKSKKKGFDSYRRYDSENPRFVNTKLRKIPFE